MAALLAVYAAPCMPRASAESGAPSEYEVKAVFLYHLITFVDGLRFQQEAVAGDETGRESNKQITIGIIGKDPFQDAFAPLLERRIQEKKVAIRYFKGFSDLNREDQEVTHHPDTEEIKKCDLIFVCSSEQKYIDQVLRPIRDERILTIADTPGFLEKGGIINVMTEAHKLRFEVNAVAAKRAKLALRSKLLRLAKRVLDEGDAKEK